ncbi:YbaK/EbsC family protein [Actinoallomurus rhizosphaericola]|uniref:YbaK/EbsC family protein n=1 Tax=Actinoallomurus rhizosphaericola TaxID=2952536 RepID=UPI002093CD4C|nr:YbaK/EbsC family protein [Actinoallomurus rhizosphaericola]MCO5997403.1 YbaK/EbsC family protein [Actinoallomurus rhizosphaericola]
MTLPTPAEILSAAGIAFSSFTHPPIRTYEDIERELKLPPELLLKTMAFRSETGFVLASLPILSRVAYGPLAKAAGLPRAALRQAGPGDLAELGMEPGGVSPLTGLPGTQIVFDVSVRAMATVHFGSGRADETLTAQAADLIEVVRPVFADLVKR